MDITTIVISIVIGIFSSVIASFLYDRVFRKRYEKKTFNKRMLLELYSILQQNVDKKINYENFASLHKEILKFEQFVKKNMELYAAFNDFIGYISSYNRDSFNHEFCVITHKNCDLLLEKLSDILGIE